MIAMKSLHGEYTLGVSVDKMQTYYNLWYSRTSQYYYKCGLATAGFADSFCGM
jgi:hypothetical protein